MDIENQTPEINDEQSTAQMIAEMEAKLEGNDAEKQDEPEADTTETDEDAKNDETQDKDDETEKDDESEKESDDAETTEDDESDTESDPILELDGKQYTEEQLTDFINNGLRQADYTRKTQELADNRKAFENEQSQWQTKVATEVQEQQQKYLEAADELAKIKQIFYPKQLSHDELTKLSIEDPAKYNKYVALNDSLNKALKDVDGIFGQNEQIQQQQLQKYAQEQVDILSKTPDFANFDQSYSKFITDLQAHNITEDVANSVLDANLIQLLNDGIKYRNAAKNVDEKTKEVTSKLKLLKNKKSVKKPAPKQKTNTEKALEEGSIAQMIAKFHAG